MTNAINSNHIQSNSINSSKIQAGAITANMITSGSMSADRISGGSINGITITGSTLRGSRIEWSNGMGSLDWTTGHDGQSTTQLVLLQSSQGIRITCTRGMNLEAGGGIWTGSNININTRWGHQNLRNLIERLYTHLGINP
jgi:hypothetical protein